MLLDICLFVHQSFLLCVSQWTNCTCMHWASPMCVQRATLASMPRANPSSRQNLPSSIAESQHLKYAESQANCDGKSSPHSIRGERCHRYEVWEVYRTLYGWAWLDESYTLPLYASLASRCIYNTQLKNALYFNHMFTFNVDYYEQDEMLQH